jgi:phenylpropionate dioxygenase-like ring-hydroxylating dioxygenase large terminal subunit
MIPNQWYAVLESCQIPSGGLIGATRMGEKLVFWRTADRVVCLRDLCAHRGAALSAGSNPMPVSRFALRRGRTLPADSR